MTRPTKTILSIAAGLLLLVGCEPDPCSDYVDYMCDCHPDDADCATLENTYANADVDLQDQCAIALEDQQAQDDEDGWECPVAEG